MSNKGPVLAYIGVAVVVVIGGLLAGYYWKGSSSSPPPSTQTTVQNPLPTQPVVATPPAQPKRQVATATDYTAPGAPEIEIDEVKGAPIPRKTEMDDADQASTNPPAPAPDDTTQPATTDDSPTPAQPADSGDTTSGTDAGTDNTDNSNSTDNVNGDNSTTPPGNDTSALTPPAPPAGPLYRVQAGTFINEANAKILASALRKRGYSAMAVPGTEDGKPVFKVQVGAYRNKALADQTASDLQKTGYPAFVSH
jgi:hypothetical protein